MSEVISLLIPVRFLLGSLQGIRKGSLLLRMGCVVKEPQNGYVKSEGSSKWVGLIG